MLAFNGGGFLPQGPPTAPNLPQSVLLDSGVNLDQQCGNLQVQLRLGEPFQEVRLLQVPQHSKAALLRHFHTGSRTYYAIYISWKCPLRT